MPADATLLFANVAAVVQATFPGKTVYTSKRQAARGKNLSGGWTEGYVTPCFIISECDPERIDEDGTFELVSVRYPILIEFVKSVQTALASGQTPTAIVEDPEFRDVRAALRAALYQPQLLAVANIIDISDTPRPVYDPAGEGKLVASGTIFSYEMWEVRYPQP